MGRRGTNPHDALVRETFGEPERARALLGSLLPADVLAEVDLGTLEASTGHFVDEGIS